jgi:hypothetical protein
LILTVILFDTSGGVLGQRITTDSALQPIVTLFFTRSPWRHGLEDYLELNYICMTLDSAPRGRR